MASRLIHYLIGTEIAKRVPVKNKNRFMAGNLYPDCIDGPGGRKGKKGRSHFWEIGSGSKQEAYRNACENFRDRYCKFMQDELYVGYFCHLLSDGVWYEGIGQFAPDIPGMDKAKKMEILYRDYHRLNELLRRDYSLAYTEVFYEKCEIEEIEPDFWETYIQCLREDFKEDTGAKKSDLELLDYDTVIGFISRAIELCQKVYTKQFEC